MPMLCVHCTQAFVEELWKNVKARGPPPDDDLTAAAQLLRLRSPQTGKPAPAHVALVELAGLLVAGHEAVGHALAWALRALASNQDVQVGRVHGGHSWWWCIPRACFGALLWVKAG